MTLWRVHRDLLRYRLRALAEGDDLGEQFITAHYILGGLVLLWPGNTTATATTFALIHDYLGGDPFLAAMWLAVGLPMLAVTLRLTTARAHRQVLLVACSVSAGTLVLFFAANPLGLATVDALCLAVISFLSYRRVDSE